MNRLFLIIVMVLSITACNPLKVTDPNDPRFDPNAFHFSDYGTRDKYRVALPIIFPVGMPRDVAEKRMLDAGATKSVREYRHEENTRVYYMWRGMFPDLQCCQNFSIAYDKNSLVYQVFMGPGKLHLNQPDWEGEL